MTKEYDINELLDLLEKTDSKEESFSPLQKFVEDMNIKKGVDRIKNSMIYYTYVEYGGDLSKIEFFRQFNKLFGDCKFRTGKQRGYKLDASSFDMSREGLIKLEYFEKRSK